MKMVLIIFFAVLMFSSSLFAQNNKITYISPFVKNKFYYNGEIISKAKISELLKANPVSSNEVEISNDAKKAFVLFGLIGSSTILYSFIKDRWHETGNFENSFYIGSGFSIVSILSLIKTQYHFKKAIDKYNQMPDAKNEKVTFDVLLKPKELCFVVNF